MGQIPFRRKIFAVLLGLIVSGFFKLLTYILVIIQIMYLYSNMYTDMANESLLIFGGWFMSLLSIIYPVFGGFAAGYYAREKGLLIGFLTGILVCILQIVFIIRPLFFVFHNATQHLIQQVVIDNLNKSILTMCLTIIFSTLSGFLGEKYYNHRKK